MLTGAALCEVLSPDMAGLRNSLVRAGRDAHPGESPRDTRVLNGVPRRSMRGHRRRAQRMLPKE